MPDRHFPTPLAESRVLVGGLPPARLDDQEVEMRKHRNILVALSLMLGGGLAMADDKPIHQHHEQPHQKAPHRTKAETLPQTPNVQQVMKLTQRAMSHVVAAEAAIRNNDLEAARTALEQSERELDQLYRNPALARVLQDLDTTIGELEGQDERVQAQEDIEGEVPPRIDLAPLHASVRSYQQYMDPAVAAGIKDAETHAQRGDARATAESLRLVRNRMAIDMAFVPLEDAYARVVAAQHALEGGDQERAARLLRGVPVVVSEVQMSQPLVPVRFKLQAAALAAEEGNHQRSQQLLREANTDITNLEQAAKGSQFEPQVTALSDELARLQQHIAAGQEPDPEAIRELANRTRTIANGDTGALEAQADPSGVIDDPGA
jgi:hypothetical protein